MIRAKVVQGPPEVFSPASFYRRLLEYALGDELLLVPRRAAASLELGSFAPSLLQTAAKGVDSALSRRRGRLVRPASNALGFVSPRPQAGARRVWVTGENARPPQDGWDLTLSFDLEKLGGTNVYCPIWWADVAVLPGVEALSAARLGHQMSLAELGSPRISDARTRSGFVCAFINNPEPMRLRAVEMLSRIGPVDVFGRISGRPSGPKDLIARNYRYMLCFENDVYPGYVTEKPFEAWATGCIPLWRGLDPSGYLNPAAYVNAATDGIDGLVQEVEVLERNEAEFQKRASAPILARSPDLAPVLRAVRTRLGQG
jgi:hypothetical protein